MKTILMTAYAVHPEKGSEDGMGWNYIIQAARNHRVVAVTRANNRAAITAYMQRNDAAYKAYFDRITFLYFDWPSWMLFWKKGPLLSMIYYYLWQYSLAVWLKRQQLSVDIVHNLNFHNDWTPSFLWMLHKPFVWGPVGHHPKIPYAYIRHSGIRAYLKDRMLWTLKSLFWRLDPFLALTRKKAKMVWCMHPESVQKLGLQQDYFLHPSVAASALPVAASHPPATDSFTVLSVGRFVPLKGFDICIRSFARFYRQLPESEKPRTRLLLVGKGAERHKLMQIAREEGVSAALDLRDWMSPEELTEVYRQASVFLYPSYEGAGMVVPEAMRYRIPVLCWDNQGPGFIVHPDSLLKVPYTDYEPAIHSFSGLLYCLWRDPAFYAREADMAYERFCCHLDWDRKADQLRQIYADIS